MNAFEPDEWQAKVEGRSCPLCGPPERRVVAVLPSGRVELVNDEDFRGYCILVHRRHVTELFELSQAERSRFVEDVTLVARVLEEQLRPAKINYEVLGNIVPHLHCHVVPRYPDDGYWGQPIWSRPSNRLRLLPLEQFEFLARSLGESLLRLR